MTYQNERAQQLALELSRIDDLLTKAVPRAYAELERGRLNLSIVLSPRKIRELPSHVYARADAGVDCDATGCLLGWARVAMPALRDVDWSSLPQWFGHADATICSRDKTFSVWFTSFRFAFPGPRADLDDRVARIQQARDEKAAELAALMGIAA